MYLCTACGAESYADEQKRDRLMHEEGCPASLGTNPQHCDQCGGEWGEVHQQANACLAPGTLTGNPLVIRQAK
jgi:hypothetical protein